MPKKPKTVRVRVVSQSTLYLKAGGPFRKGDEFDMDATELDAWRRYVVPVEVDEPESGDGDDDNGTD